MKISGNITRTFFTVYAVAYIIAMNEGTPELVQVESDAYITVNPNNTAEAKRALKAAGHKGFNSETVKTITLSEQVRSMTLDDFWVYSVEVERGVNGRVKNS